MINYYHLLRVMIEDDNLFGNWRSFSMSNGLVIILRRTFLARQGISSVLVTRMVCFLFFEHKSDQKAKQILTLAVDICITTNYKELEHVCLLAEVLAKRKKSPLTQLD
jgi:hypothetical protein